MTIINWDDDPNSAIGSGFDTGAGRVCGDCVERTDVASAGGDEVYFTIDLVTSRTEMARRLQVSASASIRAAAGTSGSGRARFFQDLSINQYSLYLVVSCIVRKASARMRDVRLKDTFKVLLENNKTEEFHRSCGNEFIVGSTIGGEFYAVYEFQTTSSDQREEVEAAVRASGALGSFSAEGDFQLSMRKLTDRYSMTFRTYAYGVPSTVLLPSNGNEIVDFARNFPQYVSSSGRVYTGSTLGYVTCENYPTLQPNPIDLQQQNLMLEDSAARRLRLLDLIASIDYILFNGSQFETFDSQHLTAKGNELRSQVNALTQAASTCLSDYRQCPLLPAQDPTVELPRRRVSSVVGAIALAKEASTQAESNALNVENYARQILEIRRRINVGPEGVQLADEATRALRDAEDSLLLTARYAEDVETTSGVTPETEEFIQRARLAVTRAREDVDTAKRLYQEVYDIGFAPYWTAPTIVLTRLTYKPGNSRQGLVDSSAQVIAFYYTFDPSRPSIPLLSNMAKCPKGGDLIAEHFFEPIDHTRGIASPIMGCVSSTGMGDLHGIAIFDNYIGISNRGDICNNLQQLFLTADQPMEAVFVLKSTQTQLSTRVALRFIRNDDPSRYREFIVGMGEGAGMHDGYQYGQIVREQFTEVLNLPRINQTSLGWRKRGSFASKDECDCETEHHEMI